MKQFPQGHTARKGQSQNSNSGLCHPRAMFIVMGTPEQPQAPDSSWGRVRTQGCRHVAEVGVGQGSVDGPRVREALLADCRTQLGWGIRWHFTPTDPDLTWAHLTCRGQQEGEGEEKPHCEGGTRALLMSGEGRE